MRHATQDAGLARAGRILAEGSDDQPVDQLWKGIAKPVKPRLLSGVAARPFSTT